MNSARYAYYNRSFLVECSFVTIAKIESPLNQLNGVLMMTLVLFAWASNDPMFKELLNANNRNAMYAQQIKNLEEEMTPFGYISTHVDIEDPQVIDGDLWLTDGYMSDLADFIRNPR